MTMEGGRRRVRRVPDSLPRLPWRSMVNPYRPIEILSVDQVEAIHRASLRILREIGVEVLGDRALDLLVAAGATVDRASRNARLEDGLTEELVGHAPHEFTLHARNPARDVVFGGTDTSSAIPIGLDWYNKITSKKEQTCVPDGPHSLPNVLDGATTIANDLIGLCKIQ